MKSILCFSLSLLLFSCNKQNGSIDCTKNVQVDYRSIVMGSYRTCDSLYHIRDSVSFFSLVHATQDSIRFEKWYLHIYPESGSGRYDSVYYDEIDENFIYYNFSSAKEKYFLQESFLFRSIYPQCTNCESYVVHKRK